MDLNDVFSAERKKKKEKVKRSHQNVAITWVTDIQIEAMLTLPAAIVKTRENKKTNNWEKDCVWEREEREGERGRKIYTKCINPCEL